MGFRVWGFFVFGGFLRLRAQGFRDLGLWGFEVLRGSGLRVEGFRGRIEAVQGVQGLIECLGDL